MGLEQNTPNAIDAAVQGPVAPPEMVDDACKDSPGTCNMYGSFWIDETEFVLPVKYIQEVVNEPANYSVVPLAPDYLKGLFDLRGMIVTVIDLRVILGFPEPPKDQKRIVAIVRNGDHYLGLLFDETGGVLNGERGVRINFDTNSDGVKDIVVEGMLKLDEGRRMLQILDPFALLGIQRIPWAKNNENVDLKKSALGKKKKFISFQIGHTNCAIDVRSVIEVTETPKIDSSLVAEGHLVGNMELRGKTIPIIDFRGVIGNETPHVFDLKTLRPRKVLIINTNNGQIGLLVYKINSILSFYESDVLELGRFAIPRQDLVSGCIIDDQEGIVILLDNDRVMEDDFLVKAAKSCQELYPSTPQETKAVQKKADSARRTYIAFTVEKRFAIDISSASEVINYPDDVLSPPYTTDFVDGILNLRGELITLINLRKLYGFPDWTGEQKRILIFYGGGKKYGIVIDKVDQIYNTTVGHIHELPAFKKDDMVRAISGDFTGCLMIDAPPNDPTIIICLDNLLARCTLPETPEPPAAAAPAAQPSTPKPTPNPAAWRPLKS